MNTLPSCLAVVASILCTSARAQSCYSRYSDRERPPLQCYYHSPAQAALHFERDANNAYLRWQTNAEKNTSHFELQLSYDNNKFETFSTIAASETTDWPTEYSIRYRKVWLSAIQVYYRIRTVYIDGSDEFSAARSFPIATGNLACFASIH